VTPPPLSIRDRLMLAQGFYFLFFGGLASVLFVADMVVAMSPRAFSSVLSGGGVAAMLVGAWRLRRAQSLGAEWSQAVRCLFIAAGLLVYLFPFFWVWRQMPRNFYFCCHGLAFLAMLMLTMMAMSVASGELARSLQRKGLTWQMVLCLISAVVIQLAPFSFLARMLATGAWHGEDSAMWLQVLVAQLHPFWITLWLLPFTLSLSLTWTAKDIALELLAGEEP
jgi:hypothetical protein